MAGRAVIIRRLRLEIVTVAKPTTATIKARNTALVSFALGSDLGAGGTLLKYTSLK